MSLEEKKDPVVLEETSPVDSDNEIATVVDIYIDPEKEKAALKKFDKYLVPVAFVFMVLSSLDRNNVSSSFFLQDTH
jgi:hypothetical protein